MTALTITLACVAVIGAVVAVLALVSLRRARGDAARATAELEARLEALESARHRPEPAALVRAEQEYVITHLGEAEPGLDLVGGHGAAPVRLSVPAFADVVLRETVVQAASLVHGVRRATAPATLNRIRFEMRRELKRSRKDRKVETREALREYRARRRAEQSEGAA